MATPAYSCSMGVQEILTSDGDVHILQCFVNQQLFTTPILRNEHEHAGSSGSWRGRIDGLAFAWRTFLRVQMRVAGWMPGVGFHTNCPKAVAHHLYISARYTHQHAKNSRTQPVHVHTLCTPTGTCTFLHVLHTNRLKQSVTHHMHIATLYTHEVQ